LTEIVLMYWGTEPPWQVLLLPLVAWVFLASGVVAWLRRPSNRMGPLLTAGAFVWLAAGLFNVAPTALVAVGLVTATLGLAVVVHLLHAFPSGRLRGRLSLWTVVAGYFVCIVLQAPAYLWQPGPLQLSDSPQLADVGHWVQVGAGSLVMISTALLLARRLAGMSRGQRLVIGPLYAYGIAAVLWIPASANLHWFAPFDPLVRFELQMAAVAGVPVVFVLALLRGGFARTAELEELGAWLGEEDGGRPDLQDALADALGDPSLELLFAVPGTDDYVDFRGGAATLPPADSSHAAIEVVRGDRSSTPAVSPRTSRWSPGWAASSARSAPASPA
jgi:hypothetical protein